LLGKIEDMAALIDDTVERVRRIARELRPGVLDDLGLEAALEWLGQDFEGRTGVGTSVRSTLGDTRVERDAATALFRIAQEALTNVARHARASRVTVLLGRDGGRLSLEVRDDGVGISDETAASTRSLGLLGMRERARRLGGDLTISAAPGRGTVVTVSVAPPKGGAP
jgi:signal transduction histidine kinase